MQGLIRVSYFAKKRKGITAYHIAMLMMFGCHIWPQPLSWHQPQLECTGIVSCKNKQGRVLPFGLDSHRLQDKWIFVYVLEDKYSKGFISFVYTGEWTCWVISVFDIHICLALTISAIRGKIHVQQHLLISVLPTLDDSLYAVFN